MTDDKVYDVIIAGAGVAGVLAAARISQDCPRAQVLLLEQRPELGGRLRSSHSVQQEWTSGLCAVSKVLYDFINLILKENPTSEDLPTVINRRHSNIDLLSGGKVSKIAIEEAFSSKMAKALGGVTASKAWLELEPQLDSDSHSLPVSKGITLGRRSSAMIVLNHLAALLGISNLADTPLKCLKQRIDYFCSGLFFGPWEQALHKVIDAMTKNPEFQLQLSCQVVDSRYDGQQWYITTEKGLFRSNSLLVAQAPWQALSWIDKKHCPVTVLNQALKTRPVSAVILVADTGANEQLDEVVLIASEGVTVFNHGDNSLCFQTLIDFEVSLDAPMVVKAIKRLKRASRKLTKMYPSIEIKGTFIALKSVAWAQSSSYKDYKLVQQLADSSKFQSVHLAFSGDSYGNSYEPDENLVASVISGVNSLKSRLQ